MADHAPGMVDALLAKAQALVDAVGFDDNGAIVAGQYVGGNGGLLSRETLKAADALRIELAVWRHSRTTSRADKTGEVVVKSHNLSTTPDGGDDG